MYDSELRHATEHRYVLMRSLRWRVLVLETFPHLNVRVPSKTHFPALNSTRWLETMFHTFSQVAFKSPLMLWWGTTIVGHSLISSIAPRVDCVDTIDYLAIEWFISSHHVCFRYSHSGYRIYRAISWENLFEKSYCFVHFWRVLCSI